MSGAFKSDMCKVFWALRLDLFFLRLFLRLVSGPIFYLGLLVVSSLPFNLAQTSWGQKEEHFCCHCLDGAIIPHGHIQVMLQSVILTTFVEAAVASC